MTPYIQKKFSIILEKLVEHTLIRGKKIPKIPQFLGWKINKICREKQTLLGISSQWLNFAVKICVCEVSSISNFVEECVSPLLMVGIIPVQHQSMKPGRY